MGVSKGESEIGQFFRTISITLAKSNHLILGCYSLALDGLAQESGALLRPLIETYELIVYFQQDKTRIHQVFDGSLPSAGEIGKRISGDFNRLRKHLNNNASHFGYETDSCRHLLNSDMQVQPMPNHSIKVLRRNLQMLNAFQVIILTECGNCLSALELDTNSIIIEIDKWCNMCKKTFQNDES